MINLFNNANCTEQFGNLTFRKAKKDDLEKIMLMLADDFLGGPREELTSPLPQCYEDAFLQIDQDPTTLLVVVEKDQKLIGTMQLIFIPGLSFKGRSKMKIEAVRVDSNLRGLGIGKIMMDFAIAKSKEMGCGAIQLVTSIERKDTHRFYHKIGFESSSLIAMELDITKTET